MSSIIRIAQIAGFSTPLFTSGIFFASSQLILPPLYDLPVSTSTPIFRQVYYNGLAVIVPLIVASTTSNAFLAYAAESSELRAIYASASASIIGTLLWTVLVMMDGIKKLNGIAESAVEQEKADKNEVQGLLRGWTTQNFVRSGLAFTGAMTSVYATLYLAVV
jgi:hypothetical protein